ncbi:MAG: hypothetical protein KME64_11850 [Scytonematopsis contorta HA4267-MV1]|jgi:hypothetical protein|nr:hypothetical protein [Scytonematopsis contorta HA4267-MV1]
MRKYINKDINYEPLRSQASQEYKSINLCQCQAISQEEKIGIHASAL